jgi:hypothetical protein
VTHWRCGGLFHANAGFDTTALRRSGESWAEDVLMVNGPALSPGAIIAKVNATETYDAFDPNGADGRNTAKGILVYGCQAAGGTVPAALRNILISDRSVRWPSAIPAEQKLAAAEALADSRIVIIDDAGEPLASSWTLG